MGTTLIWNPTSDTMIGMHAGKNFKFEPESKYKISNDAEAAHYINFLGPRGLTTLDWGDSDPRPDGTSIQDDREADALKRNKEFKIKQVVKYNMDNQARQMKQLEYLDPPKEVKAYAEELNIKLYQPYALEKETGQAEKELRDQLKQERAESRELRKQNSEMMEMQKEMLAAMKNFQGPAPAPPAPEPEKKEDVKPDAPDGKLYGFESLKTTDLKSFVITEWENIQSWPENIQGKLKKRYGQVYHDKFPEEKPAEA